MTGNSLEPEVLTTAEAARLLGISPRTLDNWRREDLARLRRGEVIKGPPWIILNRGIRYRLTAVRGFLDAAPECQISPFDRTLAVGGAR